MKDVNIIHLYFYHFYYTSPLSFNVKILFYINRYPAFGGIENITSTLANAFINQLHYDVATYSYEHDTQLLSNIPKGMKFYPSAKFDLEFV